MVSEVIMIERRAGMEVRSVGNSIVGTTAPIYDGTPGTQYELWDGTVERIAKGCFDECLRNNPEVKCMVDHKECIARTSAGNLKLTSTARGIVWEATPPNTTTTQDLRLNIEAGNVKGSSFGFIPQVIEWGREANNEIRLIKKAIIFDVSPIVNGEPAYGASSVSLRSDERAVIEKERDDYRARLETEKRLAKLDEINSRLNK